ncbi:hypothetical protein Tco_0615212 [Tanacetum coccineum]
MAPESSQVMVMPKFDMHTYTSTLTTKELKEVVIEYCIPLDLHPRLPPPKLTMDKLPSKYIGIYVEQLEQGGLRIPFSAFFLVVIKHFKVYVSQLVPIGVNRVVLFEIRCRSLNINATVSLFQVFYKLCKQGHWFSFENKTGVRSKKCFKEVTSSLKKKFFLIDRREIPEAMPWRHTDTDVRDDLPTNYNEDDAARLAEHVDSTGQVLSMDDFLQLLVWTGTVVSKGDPIPDDKHPVNRTTPLSAGKLIPKKTVAQRGVKKPDTKIAKAREKKEKLALAKTQLKHAGEGGFAAPRNKKAHKAKDVAASNFEETTFVTPILQANLKPLGKTMTFHTKGIAEDADGGSRPPNIEKEVVDLSESTRVPTPPGNIVRQEEPVGRGDPQDHVVFSDAHSFYSGHDKGDDEDDAAYRFVPD